MMKEENLSEEEAFEVLEQRYVRELDAREAEHARDA